MGSNEAFGRDRELDFAATQQTPTNACIAELGPQNGEITSGKLLKSSFPGQILCLTSHLCLHLKHKSAQTKSIKSG